MEYHDPIIPKDWKIYESVRSGPADLVLRCESIDGSVHSFLLTRGQASALGAELSQAATKKS